MGLLAWLAHKLGQCAVGAECSGRERGTRGDQAMQDQHAHLRTPVARGERLAVSPDAQHRVALARVELGYDGNLHQPRWVAKVRCISWALRYGRSARKARASAIAASRE